MMVNKKKNKKQILTHKIKLDDEFEFPSLNASKKLIKDDHINVPKPNTNMNINIDKNKKINASKDTSI
jgi:hypothetical protein